MMIKELKYKEEMLKCLPLLNEVYPTLTPEEYSEELDLMLTNNYSQVVVELDGEIVGIVGYWFGSKLWCRKYIECDNVVVSKNHRRKGIAKMIFNYIEDKARQLDCTILALDSYTDNFSAHKFFYQEGYVPRGFHFINVLDDSKIR